MLAIAITVMVAITATDTISVLIKVALHRGQGHDDVAFPIATSAQHLSELL